MIDTTAIIAITSLSAVGVAILGKVLFLLRTNIKNCCGIQFRTPPNSVTNKNETQNNNNEIEITETNTNTIHITPQILNQLQSSGRNLV